ncbi:hypothetical protein CC80DRAFT_592942 [Byssothecium circinans]|uniref:HECT-type E3 ubiquitin transferase n=1 Tax=Byssothecium circinans TaxID=147558 RepID=A0A6A5TWW0_9PLEO|nr:hypothetical protein CC80DRAFT_592942 [Byssothecium circinans]
MTRRETWDDVTDVDAAHRLLECSQLERQLRFQYLVRRIRRLNAYEISFLSQILNGCTSASCTTPTCLSCNKRLISRPFRPPTPLTARALAYYLASQPDPHGRLCPHQLKVDPNTLEIEGADGIILGRDTSTGGQICDVFPAAHSLTVKDSQSIAQRHQAKKDPKSHGQSIYDTVTIIYSYSKKLPSPRSLLALLRSETVTDGSNDHAVNGTRSPPPVDTQSPQPIRRRHSRSNGSQIISETLSNGQHVHKIRHVPGTGSNGRVSNRTTDPPSLQGVSEAPHLGRAKMRTKSGSLHLSSRLISEIVTPMPTQNNTTNHAEVSEQGYQPSLPVTPFLTCDILDKLKDEVYHGRNEQSSHFNCFVEYDNAHRHFRPSKPFVNRSLFFTLSDPETLLKSFRDISNPDYQDSPLPHLDAYRLTNAFSDWNRRNGALVFDSLWIAAGALFRPPPELDTQKSPRLKPSRKDAPSDHASERSPPFESHSVKSTRWSNIWPQLRKFRGWGVILPGPPSQTDSNNGFARLVSIVDELEYEPAVRLADRLLRGIGTRMCFEHILVRLGNGDERHGKTSEPLQASPLLSILIEHLAVVERIATARKAKHKANQSRTEDPGWTVTAIFLEWLRTVIIKKFDGKAEVNKWSSVGAAISILERLHVHMSDLNLQEDMFSIPYLNEHIDTTKEPTAFLDWEERPNSFHLFQFPFLFKDAYLVAYFRAINFNRMFDQFQQAGRTSHLEQRFSVLLDDIHRQILNDRIRVTTDDFLRLDVHRDDPLKQTLDHLWGREKRMLLKPLKVEIGKGQGEVGLDQGGVTYEFFRIVLGEAFTPANGLFTIDPHTRMIWFRPTILEPLWKYQMLGVLFSLAIYNGITLPVTFPLAFYTYLLGSDHDHVKVDTTSTNYIRDGWPMLAKSFDELLAFEGDVEGTFMRDYTFVVEAFDCTYETDMQTGKPPKEDVSVVTNANRAQFVKDYITWLTHTSVKDQLAAFRTGFLTCLHPKSLNLFTPKSLRSLVEGTQTISTALLRKHTRYEDGYSATHPTILDFWAIVETYSQEDMKRLLEFVTANERVPVSGYESISFIIVRRGGDTDLLPSSSTCFGKLMLPEYAGREKMRGKLRIALENAKGFGDP